ncbi:MAG TPA: NAD-dependent epimerase [Bryobacteraceae bacterium]|nr:NAD-dependent epimerase [Bryobacteraceae bacterium]
MTMLVTGAAGFIGFHLARRLLAEGHRVHGVDNLNDYYDPSLKQARLALLVPQQGFSFQRLDIADSEATAQLFRENNFDTVVNLAAQAGVRHSLKNPIAYVNSNLLGFVNILEGCASAPVRHLVFASSSSVYGANRKVPFSVEDRADHPVSLYGATKKANELIAHSYSHLYNLPVTGLRFFTVYGPWGRPDMAYYKFVRAIDEGRPIDLYNHGEMHRDFTYIDDALEGIIRVLAAPPARSLREENPDGSVSDARFRVYNIGNSQTVWLAKFVDIIEEALSKKAIRNYLPMQPGDVSRTHADTGALFRDLGFTPQTSLETGIHNFVRWYREYHGDVARGKGTAA